MRYKVSYRNIHTYAHNGIELDSAIRDLLRRECVATEIKIEVSTTFETIDPKTVVLRQKYHRVPVDPSFWNPDCAPIKVRRSDLRLLDGYMRVQAAIAAGIKEIRVEFVEE